MPLMKKKKKTYSVIIICVKYNNYYIMLNIYTWTSVQISVRAVYNILMK